MVVVCVAEEPAGYDSLLAVGRALAQKAVYSLVVVGLKKMPAVYNKKAVVRATQDIAHTAVDIRMIVLELPQRAAASALIFRLFALEVNGIRVAYDAQNFFSRAEICVDEHIPAVRCMDVFFNVIALKEHVAESLALVADFYKIRFRCVFNQPHICAVAAVVNGTFAAYCIFAEPAEQFFCVHIFPPSFGMRQSYHKLLH